VPVALVLVTATAVAVGLTYTDHAPLIPLLAAEFGLTDVQAGLLSTALFVAAVVVMLLGGGLADRYGAKLVVSIGLAFSLAGNAAFGLAPSYPWLIAAKAAGGIGSGVAFIAGVRYIASLYGGARSHVGQGIYGGGYPLGSALGVWAMAPLATAYGWRAAIHAASAFIAVVFVAWLLAPDVPRTRATGRLFDALTCANCWLTCVEHAAGFGLSLAAGTWITVYLLREFALPLELSGALGSLLLVIAVFARPLGGYLVARRVVTTKRMMRVAQLAILSGLALLAIPGRPLAAALAGTLLVGLGVGLPYAAVFNTAGASLPSAPGASQGLTAVGGTAGALVLAPLIGYAIERAGFSAAWMLLAAVSLAALAATFVVRGEEELTVAPAASD
jgi:nitrate/nitrite transporter NarK